MASDSGLLVLSKSPGITSFDMVSRIRRHLGITKAGHCGTLDPMASGVLLVLLGNATKAQAHFMRLPKIYRAVIRFGVETDTGDRTGRVCRTAPWNALTFQALEHALDRFRGDVWQVPPMYSALKFHGRPLYYYARRGVALAVPPRRVTFYNLSILRWAAPDVEMRIHCSSGTYIRALAEDLGRSLGSAATVAELEREAVGPYDRSMAIGWEELKRLSVDQMLQRVLPIAMNHPELVEGCKSVDMVRQAHHDSRQA